MKKLVRIYRGRSLSDKAYETIRDGIIAGDLKPGDMLGEKELAAGLGISRTPLRVALKKLVYDHLATVNGTNNVIVNSISQQEVSKISVVRANLEVLAVSQIEYPVSADEIRVLEGIYQRQCEMVWGEESVHHGDFVNLDYEFHVMLASFADNQYLLELVEKINLLIKIFLALSGTLNTYSRIAIDEHKTILEAVRCADKDGAILAMGQHITNIGERMLVTKNNISTRCSV